MPPCSDDKKRRLGSRLWPLFWLALCCSLGTGWAGMPPPAPPRPASSAPIAWSIRVPEPEPADLTALAKISAAAAMAAAEAAYPGARVRALALENENGFLVYSVRLSNGLEVKVDAGTGRVSRPPLDDEAENQE